MSPVETIESHTQSAGGWPAWIGRHGTRLLALLIVAAVVFKATRTSPEAGTRSLELPQPAAAADEAAPAPKIDHANRYAWLTRRGRAAYIPLRERIPPPEGFQRVDVEPGSFADWLRNLPVAPSDRAVTNFRRQVVIPAGDPQIAAVIDLQPGAGNLLTAPAMAVRLRAEYAWVSGGLPNLVFHYTSGHPVSWADWAAGQRPVVRGRKVEFEHDRPADASRESFCGYLETLFRYTTVYSLLQDTQAASDASIAAGDVFVTGGRLGMAVLVLDVATGPGGGVRVLLGQGGNPAVTFHVPCSVPGQPWCQVSKSRGISLQGREWLKLKDLRHWKQ